MATAFLSRTPSARKLVAWSLAASLSFAGMMQGAQAALIGTEQVAAVTQPAAASHDARAQLLATLDRADVVSALQQRGVSPDAARARVATLTDAEAADLAQRIDQAPAGADALGVILGIFIVLLITDLLGWTKVFPFTRTIR